MTDLTSIAAFIAGSTLSLADWLAHLKQRGQLRPLLRQAAIEQFLVDQARQAGLTVSTEELQQAADAFRQCNRLNSAEQTNAWLAQQRLSVLDLETTLERDLLIAKLKDHLASELDKYQPPQRESPADKAR
jgi:hypothetical protein